MTLRLLLATEHSEFDAGAESVAFALAARADGRLHAVLPLVSNAEFEASAPALAARADDEIAARRERLVAAAAAAGVALQVNVRRGTEAHAEILAQAQEDAADLLVIRRRGKRGFLARLLVGEMVGQVLAQAPCNVLVAPRSATVWQRGVVVAVGDAQARGALLDAARELAPGLPLREAAPGEALVIATRERADLIVAARAQTTTARLLGEATCAVLVVV
jgi:nucleotide-binding universal stress UspA family protein